LIELIVTISIMSALLGILLPVLPRVLDSSRRAACAANYHGIAQAFQMYRDANKNTYPKARVIPPPWLSGDTDPPLRDALLDYVSSPDAWRCPGDRTVFDFPYEDDEGEKQITGMSYSYATALSGLTHDQSFYAKFLRHKPEDTVLSHDFDGGTFETQEGQNVQVDFFHEKRNILFADGHIRGAS